MILHCNAGHATSNDKYWEMYVRGHAQVLKDFGIEVLDSYGEDWSQNPNVRLIIITDTSGQAIGGIKLHKVHKDFSLPVQTAIGEESALLSELIHGHTDQGVGEICGLWISSAVSKRGLAYYLTRVAIAICKAEHTRVIYGISSPFTLHMFQALGYEIITELGDKGNYYYPTPEFVSTAVAIADTYLLPKAEPFHRERIFSLREEPVQSALELHGGVETLIHYNLSEIVS